MKKKPSVTVGLNVVGANHVIHYSRHWNPAKESQATDRVHRIGQSKPVYVYYPMAILKDIETFDKVLNNLLEQKRTVAHSALFPSEAVEVKIKDMVQKL